MAFYETLRAKRNEMFPERCKLDFGCEVRNKYASEENPHRVFALTGGNRYRGYAKGELVRLAGTAYHDGSDSVEILGQPVSIADVLRMSTNVGPVIYVDMFGWINRRDQNGEQRVAHIDLSRPLSEQEEVCEKILAVLGNK